MRRVETGVVVVLSWRFESERDTARALQFLGWRASPMRARIQRICSQWPMRQVPEMR